MYPPGGRAGAGQTAYSPLPNDAEAAGFDINDTFDASPSLKQRLNHMTKNPLFRPIVITFSFLLAVALFKIFFSGEPTAPTNPPVAIEHPDPRPMLVSNPPTKGKDMSMWRPDAFSFSSTPRPAYLDKPVAKPLVLRLAIIARVDGFERRQAMREAVLAGVRSDEVKIDYRFFVGRAKDGVEGLNTKLRLVKENRLYNDVIVLDELREVPERLSEKRFEAIKWTNSIPYHQYDYSMTIDSDTFCRFSALARRLQHAHANFNPREQPIMVGRMGQHRVYFENTIPDGNKNDSDEDHYIVGPWYKYPIGIGYMLSSNITQTILNIDPPVAHHINYPSDDVMIGSWLGGLRYYPDTNVTFQTSEHDNPPNQTVYPKPYLPYSINTTIYDDQVGWHDVKEKTQTERPIGWDSVCIHRMKVEQMRSLRTMDEIKEEWDAILD